MVVKLSISLDKELAELIKKDAESTGRTVSEVFVDAIKAYQKEKRRESYTRFAQAKSKKLQAELNQFEKIQSEAAKKLG